MKRRHAELEINIAQNMVLQVKVGNDACTGSGVRGQGSGVREEAKTEQEMQCTQYVHFCMPRGLDTGTAT